MKDSINDKTGLTMKKCPKCQSDVDDNFDLCWNCQYSFADNVVLNDNDFMIICPKCNSEVKPSLNSCSNCHNDLTYLNIQTKQRPQVKNKIDCLRCNVQLDYKGNFKFHEGSRVGAFGDLFEIFLNRESFDLYSCSKCGKIEFFLPGFD